MIAITPVHRLDDDRFLSGNNQPLHSRRLWLVICFEGYPQYFAAAAAIVSTHRRDLFGARRLPPHRLRPGRHCWALQRAEHLRPPLLLCGCGGPPAWKLGKEKLFGEDAAETRVGD
ncbi:unnamed protein product [Urochloa humidicola]